jgi:hypothetical protein
MRTYPVALQDKNLGVNRIYMLQTIAARSLGQEGNMIAVVGILGGSRASGKSPQKKALPTICPECELGLGCVLSSPSARFSALRTFQAFWEF